MKISILKLEMSKTNVLRKIGEESLPMLDLFLPRYEACMRKMLLESVALNKRDCCVCV